MIFEVNNTNPVAEPRASVLHISTSGTSPFTSPEKNGPRVKLTVGDREYILLPQLAEVLSEELRVAAALCRVAEEEETVMRREILESLG